MVARDFKTTVLPVSNKLLRFARHFLHDEDAARDVVQDVFLKLWQKKDELAKIDNIEAFAMQMTRNRCLDVLRARRIIPMDEAIDRQLEAETEDLQERLEWKEAARQIKGLIDQLPDLQKTVMYCRDIEHMEYEEIADLTGVKINAIRVNLSRARKKVREDYLKINENENIRNKTNSAKVL